jgi:hypothetical protein
MKHPSRGKVIEKKKKKKTRYNQTKRALEFRAAVHHNNSQQAVQLCKCATQHNSQQQPNKKQAYIAFTKK